MSKKYIPLVITAFVVVMGAGLVYTLKQKSVSVDLNKSVTKQATEEDITTKESTVSAVVEKSQINNPVLKKVTPSVTSSPTSTPVPSVLPTPSFKPSFATIILSQADSETPNASGKVVVELYDMSPSYDPRATLASFRMNGSVSSLKANTAYWIGVYGTKGVGVGFLKFTTDASGNASIKLPKDTSYGGMSTGFTPDDPLSFVAISEDGARQFKPVLKGDFVIIDNTISPK